MFATNERKFPKRERVTIPEIMEKFPKGVTLNHVKLVDSKYGANVICHIAEDDEVYFFGGKILTEKITKACEDYTTGEFGLNADIYKCGGWPLMYVEVRSQAGNTYYKPHVVMK